MPSEFDTEFRNESTPELMKAFGETIAVVAKTGEGLTETYSPTAQVGNETIRRVRGNNGTKVLRTREVIVSLDAADGVTQLPEAALKTLHFANYNSIRYVITGYDFVPGRQAKLTLEREDPSDITRPNLRSRN